MGRYVIYGAGAAGGVIAAKLHGAGQSVHLIARGAHFDALCSSGLVFEYPGGRENFVLPVSNEPAAAGFQCRTIPHLAREEPRRVRCNCLAGRRGDCLSPPSSSMIRPDWVAHQHLDTQGFVASTKSMGASYSCRAPTYVREL